MKELVETIVKALVDVPEEVVITEIAGDQAVIYEIKVSDKDIGKVIGKQGRTANALRVIVKAAASKIGKNASVQINSKPKEETMTI
ncbi:MAG: KH domain-containing protein [Caldisericaceae bacterium]|nr:KH domain-containing protein [Caldisericaceae bacterium]RLD19346.1 MAG: RNA-binding protein [Caldisericota bacterium]